MIASLACRRVDARIQPSAKTHRCAGATAPAQHRDERAPSVIGLHARPDLILYRNGRTVLAQAYAEPPFRVGRCFAESDGPDLILTSSAPGAFGNDHLQQIVRVGCGVRVWLRKRSRMRSEAWPGRSLRSRETRPSEPGSTGSGATPPRRSSAGVHEDVS